MKFSAAEQQLIKDTIEFIKIAHEGQMYGSDPYWMHPLAVANAIPNPTIDEYIAALLHDVVEDTSFTLVDLAKEYPPAVIAIVDLLTKQPGLSYYESIERIIKSNNKSAMRVKYADNTINSGGDKSHMPKERQDRLRQKYTMSMKMLQQAIGGS